MQKERPQPIRAAKDNKDKVFFLTGGGTGGHIYPCVSVLCELKKAGFMNIYYVGNAKNQEFDVIQNLNKEFENASEPFKTTFLHVPALGMPRKISFKLIRWAVLLFAAVVKCVFYALKYRPDAVFATGGYVSAPMVICANLFGIPYVMHDSDACPGIVTRAFSGGAKAVNLAFSGAGSFVKAKKITNYKNPVRDEFFAYSKEDGRKIFEIGDEFTIFITGGSQGARTLNNAALGLIEHFRGREDIKIIFQTGKKNFDDVMKQIEKVPENAIIKPYFEKMYFPVLASDIVISRAGSLSISEILSAKKPSILVPYPYAAADHQRKNAREIEKIGAAIYMEDADVSGERLSSVIEELILDKNKLNALRENASKCIEENPTGKIVQLVLDAACSAK